MPRVNTFQIDYQAPLATSDAKVRNFGFIINFNSSHPVEVVTSGLRLNASSAITKIAAVEAARSGEPVPFVRSAARYVLGTATCDSFVPEATVDALVDQWDAQGLTNPFVSGREASFRQSDVIAFAASVDRETPDAVKANWGIRYQVLKSLQPGGYVNVGLVCLNYGNPEGQRLLSNGNGPMTVEDQVDLMMNHALAGISPEDALVVAEDLTTAVESGNDRVYSPFGDLSAPAVVRLAYSVAPGLRQSDGALQVQSR